MSVLLVVTIARARAAGWRLVLPIGWIAAYYGPVLLTRNVQIYYTHEALAGIAILVGSCLDTAAARGLQRAWSVALAIVALSGLASNYVSLYSWQASANAARQVEERILRPLHGAPIESLTFVATNQPFWQWVLTADGKGPMIATLLGRPSIQVQVIGHEERSRLAPHPDATHLLIVIDEELARNSER
jgi:hypothetical protein